MLLKCLICDLCYSHQSVTSTPSANTGINRSSSAWCWESAHSNRRFPAITQMGIPQLGYEWAYCVFSKLRLWVCCEITAQRLYAWVKLCVLNVVWVGKLSSVKSNGGIESVCTVLYTYVFLFLVPLVSRFLPCDTCRVYKKGCLIR